MSIIPKVGDTIWLLVPGCGDVDNTDQPDGDMDYVEVPAVEPWKVVAVDTFPAPQNLAFTIVHASGVVNVIDDTDKIDGAYPFEVVPLD